MIALRAGDVRRPGVRAAADAGRERRVDHRPRGFDADVLLLRLVSAVCPVVRLKPDAPSAVRTVPSRSYLWSVALFFAALFSKQNTITLAPALVLFDASSIGAGSSCRGRGSARTCRMCVLTAGFLAAALRAVPRSRARKRALAQRFREFISDSSRHLARLVFGGAGLRHWAARDTIIVSLASIAVAVIRGAAPPRGVARRLWRPAFYFGADLDCVWHGADPGIWILLATSHVPRVARLGRDARHRARHPGARAAAALCASGRRAGGCRAADGICRPVTGRCSRLEQPRRNLAHGAGRTRTRSDRGSRKVRS